MSLQEIEPILEMGVDLRLNSPVDATKLEGLLREFDAVFLAVGLGATARLDLPGEDLSGVWEALAFIRQLHEEKPLSDCFIGRRVVVLGCGNTAIDAATQALRLGAETVTIAYRRGEDAKSAYNYEYDLGKADGVRFEWFAAPTAFVGEGGLLTGVRFVRTSPTPGGRGGELHPVPGSDFVLPCDMAIKALGQGPVESILAGLAGVERRKGAVVVHPETFMTTRPGLFAGGDCTSKGKEIVNAVQDGKLAARAIHSHLATKG